MANYVGGVGNACADIFLCGEAPGAREDESGVPFSGPAGELLNECLRSAGIERDACYLTNVVKVRPPDNKLEKLPLIGHTVEEFLPQLWNEIQAINPKVVVAVGGTALKYITGFDGIEKYRGSILRASKTGHKVIPILHPASLLHESSSEMTSWKELAYIKIDLKRVVEESLTREIILPDRCLLLARNSLDLCRFLDHSTNPFATLDVETFKTYPICAALAFDRNSAMSVPLFDENIPPHDLAYLWKLMAEFLADTKISLIAQNAKFDEKRCRQIGLKFHDVYFDTGMAWHTLYSELPKKLQFISSILTREPYYKDEGKEYNPKKDSFDKLMSYNAKDAVVEYECFEEELKELKETGMIDFFFTKIMPLHRLYSDIEDVGILIDETVRKNLGEKYHKMREEKHSELIKLILGNDSQESEFAYKSSGKGNPVKHVKIYDFNVNSPQQVAAMLYGYLNCPIRKDVAEDTLKSLANNAVKDQRRKDIIKDTLEERKISKSIGTYIEARLSDDERLHTQYNINGTESGRTSTSALKPPVSITPEGIALQTMTKHEDEGLIGAGGADLRSMFIADPGYSFVEPDGAQAEDRVVCVLSCDWDALKDYQRTVFVKNRFGLKDDRHTKTAVLVCEKGFEDINEQDRQIGKKTRHAGNYGMGKHTHMLNLAKFANIFISEWRAGKQLDLFHRANPNIRGIFHAQIQQALLDNDCVLTSPHGRIRRFFNRWGEELFKEAYAHLPQCTVSDQVKFAMLRIKERLIKYYLRLFAFVGESHDSFLALVKDELIPEFAAVSKEEMEKPIDFSRCSLSRKYELVIPCEIKVGKRWIGKSADFPDGMVDYKC